MLDVEDDYPHCRLRRSQRKPVADAVEEIAKRLGIVAMEAKVKLIEALRAGRIRAHWRGHYSRTSPPIARTKWEGADIELSTQTVVLADGGRMALVDLNRQDYEAWLEAVAAPIADLATKGKRYVGDEELVAEGVEGIRANRWPNAHKAAIELTQRACGPATLGSKIDRIHGKIRDRLRSGEEPRNIPKHPE